MQLDRTLLLEARLRVENLIGAASSKSVMPVFYTWLFASSQATQPAPSRQGHIAAKAQQLKMSQTCTNDHLPTSPKWLNLPSSLHRLTAWSSWNFCEPTLPHRFRLVICFLSSGRVMTSNRGQGGFIKKQAASQWPYTD